MALMGNSSSVRVLYIDDNPSLCGIFRASVEAQGYLVDTALTGKDGMSMFTANPYDLVVLEYSLPDMTGIEVAQNFLEAFPNLPILIVTGQGDERIAVETMMLGISNYIVKGDVTVYLELIPGSISQLIDRATRRRKQIETAQALRESEQRFRDFAESSSDWFWEMGPDLKFTYISDRVEDLYGITANSQIGKTREEFAGEDILLKHWQEHAEVLKRHEPFRDFQYFHLGPDGTQSILSISGIPISNTEGKFRGYRGTGTDVTEKTANENLIRETDKERQRLWSRLTTAMDTIDESVVIYDNEDRLVFANQRQKDFYPDLAPFYECPGTPMETIVRRHGETLQKSDPALNLNEYVGERIPGIPQENVEYQLDNGRWVSKTLRRTPDGGTINVREDITEKKRIMAESVASNEMYRQLFDNNRAVQLIIDPHDGQIVDANNAATKYYGYTHEDLISKNIGDINTLNKKNLTRAIRRLLEEQKDHYFYKHRLASGEIRDVQVHSGPVKIKGNELLYSIIHDVTDRKIAEKAIIEKDLLLIAAIESVDGGIAIYDSEDRLVLHNTKYKTYLSDAADHIKSGARFKDLVTKLATSGFYEQSKEAANAWVSSRMKLFKEGAQAAPHKDKHGNWRQSNFFKLHDGGTFLLTLNVTDMMEAVLAKEDSEQRFKDFATSSADWTWEMDADLCITYVSPNIERIIGVKPEWHYGKTREEVLGNSFDLELWEPHLETLNDHKPFRDLVYLEPAQKL